MERFDWIGVLFIAAAVGLFVATLWGIGERAWDRWRAGGGLPVRVASDAPPDVASLAPVSIGREPEESREIPPAPASQVRRVGIVPRFACPERVAAWSALAESSRVALAELGGAVEHERIGCPRCLALARAPCDRQTVENVGHLELLRAEVDAERLSASEELTRVFRPDPERRPQIAPGALYAQPGPSKAGAA